MDYRELSALLVKVSGAIIIIDALSGVPTYVSYYFTLQLPEHSFLTFLGISILPLAIPLFAGVFLFKFPYTITNKIISTASSPSAASPQAAAIEVVALSVLGVYLLFRAISDLIYHGFVAFQYENPIPIASIVATIFELVFAAILLFGAAGVATILQKVRGRAS